MKPLVIIKSDKNRFDLRDNTIHLDIPVPKTKNNFKHINTYYIKEKKAKKAILVHITNYSTEEICGKNDVDTFLPFKINFNDVKPNSKGKKLKLKEKDELYVYIVNDIPSDFTTNSLKIKDKISKLFSNENHEWGCRDLNIITNDENIKKSANPEEAGGGVIVKNP